MKYFILVSALVTAACDPGRGSVECEQNSNCSLESGGICATNALTGNKWCTYPCNADKDDNICSSGRCWSDFDVGDGVSGACYGDTDAGVDPMVDASIGIDAPVTDAGDPDAAVNGPLADLVLGQSDFTTNVANQGGIGYDTLFAPSAVFASAGGLWVVDTGNNRVLEWPSPPVANKEAASGAYGQSTGTGSSSGTSASQLNLASGTDGGAVMSDGTRVIIADSGNNRVLIWNDTTTPADLVLGQTDFTSNTAGGGPSQMAGPRGVWTDGTRLVVSDTENHRVLIWNSFPTTNGQAADVVLGGGGSPSATTMSRPQGVVYDGTRLWVADAANNRVLVWNAFPTTDSAPADFVLGQTDFSSNVTNMGGSVGPATLSQPYDVAIGDYAGVPSLFVADFDNWRVLVFSPLPTTTGASATAVYGRPDLMSGATVDVEPLSAGRTRYVTGVSVHGNRLYVSESGGLPQGDPNRVLRFTLPPAP